jgi:hypothetical protein
MRAFVAYGRVKATCIYDEVYDTIKYDMICYMIMAIVVVRVVVAAEAVFIVMTTASISF